MLVPVFFLSSVQCVHVHCANFNKTAASNNQGYYLQVLATTKGVLMIIIPFCQSRSNRCYDVKYR